jgi:hypothetical protein
MQKWIAYMLIAALVVPASLKVGVLFHYVLDYNNYVSVLCENRDKPEMKCNGQCHLAKQLKAVGEPSDAKGATPIPSQLQTELIFLPSTDLFTLSTFPEPRSKWITANENDLFTTAVTVVVPPPEYIA